MNKLLLALALMLAAVGAQAQPNRISGAGGGGCTTNCTLTGTTTTTGIADSGGVNTTGTVGFEIGGVSVLSTVANASSPILSPETQNNPQTGATYQGNPFVIGFNSTAGVNTYASMETGNLTVTGTVANHWGLKELSINVIGGGTLNAELNQEKSLVQVASGTTITSGENYEAKISNNGTSGTWTGFLSVPQNNSGANFTGTLYGFNSIYSNNAAAALSLVVDYSCGSNGGTGTAASFHVCIFNQDPKADIDNEGHWNTRPNNVPTMSAGCGTSPSLTAASSDGSGTITIGTSPGATCVLTFARAYVTNAPTVVISSPSATALPAYSTSTTALTLTSPTAGGVFSFWVMGSH